MFILLSHFLANMLIVDSLPTHLLCLIAVYLLEASLALLASAVDGNRFYYLALTIPWL